MQPHVRQEDLEPTLRIGSARERLRNFRRSLSNSFRKTQKPGINIKANTDIFHVSFPAKSHGSLGVVPTTPISISLEPFGVNVSPCDTVMDGATERMFRRSPLAHNSAAVSSIFVHAGAGYHSTTNEHIHLGACDSAARMAMRILKAGGTAVDAVEAAIKVLEDKEITNAGYGSNLAIDGVVECDATVVDHLGRSGACGAAAQIKNPINLARAILDASSKPLSLRRVPPNLLVGQGATDFAWEQGLPVLPHEMLVSRNARDRYVRWRDDLERAEGTRRMTPSSSAASIHSEDGRMTPEVEERMRSRQRRDHTHALLNGTWNEGQPDSPQPSSPQPSPLREQVYTLETCPPVQRSPSPVSPSPYVDRNHGHSNPRVRGASPNNLVAKRPRYNERAHSLLGPGDSADLHSSPNVGMCRSEALANEVRPGSSDGHMSPPTGQKEVVITSTAFFHEGTAESASKFFEEGDDDLITDTVGAIAIDMYGHIAAGSSSGGIGMKHRGRVGPAALVGIGSAVIPADDGDPEGICVAAVTSGTGEHMATTMASQKCADRLYNNTRRAHGGADVDATEEEAMISFVQADFMGHPGVAGSNSAGAIGVMAVKKTPYGYFLHFAHNTDSFALASMHSNEKDAKCVMSRIGDHNSVVQGGRKIRLD